MLNRVRQSSDKHPRFGAYPERRLGLMALVLIVAVVDYEHVGEHDHVVEHEHLLEHGPAADPKHGKHKNESEY